VKLVKKKEKGDKKMNLMVKELEGDGLMTLMTKGDEDTPRSSARRTLSKKDLKKQHTLEKEEEASNKYKRKSNKAGTKKLGIQ